MLDRAETFRTVFEDTMVLGIEPGYLVSTITCETLNLG